MINPVDACRRTEATLARVLDLNQALVEKLGRPGSGATQQLLDPDLPLSPAHAKPNRDPDATRNDSPPLPLHRPRERQRELLRMGACEGDAGGPVGGTSGEGPTGGAGEGGSAREAVHAALAIARLSAQAAAAAERAQNPSHPSRVPGGQGGGSREHVKYCCQASDRPARPAPPCSSRHAGWAGEGRSGGGGGLPRVRFGAKAGPGGGGAAGGSCGRSKASWGAGGKGKPLVGLSAETAGARRVPLVARAAAPRAGGRAAPAPDLAPCAEGRARLDTRCALCSHLETSS